MRWLIIVMFLVSFGSNSLAGDGDVYYCVVTSSVQSSDFFTGRNKFDVLKNHTDRSACAVSGTMNLGGNLWPIYLKESSKKVHKVLLIPGDILLYDGCKFEHWREKFEGEVCTQVFFHYNKKGSKNIYDGRARLGLPSDIKKK